MKRATILVIALCAATAMAQVHGVPASVTSMGPGTGKGYTPGVPASVTSLGPNGYGTPFGAPPMRPPTTVTCFGGGMYCYPTTNPPVNSGFNGHRHHGHGTYGYGYGYGYGGYAYGYAPLFNPVYPAYTVDGNPMAAGYEYLQPTQPATVEEAEPAAPTIFERRPATRPYARDEARYDEDYVPPARQAGKSTEIGVGEQDTTTLVFADGHKMDVHNYAIVGSNLFNFDGTGPFKIKLAELNLAATEKLNEDNGVIFKLPK